MTKSKNLSTAAIFAALYFIIGALFPMISFGPIQCRVADALYPLIAIYGWPSIVGLTLGGLLYNYYGLVLNVALGPLDLLSPIVFLPAKIAIMKWGYKASTLHVLAVGLWVPYLLWRVLGLPILVTMPSVMIGEAIAELVLGGLLLRRLEALR